MKVIEFGSEFDWEANYPFQTDKNNKYFDFYNMQAYRSGRDALKAIAYSYKAQTKTVLLPALCCESMVSPFLMNGYKPVFYKMNADYTVNVKDIENKIERDCLILYMSYFGVMPISVSQLMEWKKAFSPVFIEDRTHNILHKKEDSFIPDITMASIRKWFALPDGGILFADKIFEAKPNSGLEFADLRLQAMKKKSKYLLEGGEDLKDEYRRLLTTASESLDKNIEHYEISSFSKNLLSNINFEKILLQRQKNIRVLKSFLDIMVQQERISYITDEPEKSALYFPFLVKNRDALQEKLAREKIYCPVIWPVPQEAQGVCEIADYTAKHMIALPCDQRYDEKDMRYIGSTIMKLVD